MNDFYKIDTTVSSTIYKGLTINKLFNHQFAEVLLICLEKNGLFPKHDSPRNAMLQMLEGEITVHINQKTFVVKNQESFRFPAKEVHSVTAQQNSKFLIIR